MRAKGRPDYATAVGLALLLAFVLGGRCLAGSGGLSEAISLYEEARYAEALEMLNGLSGADDGVGSPSGARVAEYRALCLMALERDAEAQGIVRTLLSREPTYRPTRGQFPPRFLALVEETRSAVVPDLVRAEYRLGKTKYDEKAYPEAAAHLAKVVAWLDDDALAPGLRESLADLRDLARGFLTLVETPAQPVPPLPPPTETTRTLERAVPVLYTAADAGVRPPRTVRQEMPPWRSGFDDGRRTAAPGELELIVDENGRVASARITASVERFYDQRLLEAAKYWHYEPATKDGRPVRYKKVISIRVTDPTARIP